MKEQASGHHPDTLTKMQVLTNGGGGGGGLLEQ